MTVLLKLLLVGSALYVAVVAAAYFGQRWLIYMPDARRTLPAAIGLSEVRERILQTSDGQRLIVWHGAAKPAQPTLLYFHGNGSALADREPRFRRFMGEGWGVFMLSYRGYGGSTGKPTERDNVADAARAYDMLAADGVGARDIVLYGESLGTGVAAQLALQRPAAALVLEAPYTSLAEVGARRYSFLPVERYILDRYDTAVIIGRVTLPVLVIHGSRDGVVPVDMGRRVADLAPAPKTYVEFPSGGHNDLYLPPNEALGAVRAFVHGLRPQ